MQRSTTETSPTSDNLSQHNVQYYYPAGQIRSLIKSLDEELKALSQQCVVKKSDIIRKQKSVVFPKFQSNKMNSTNYNIMVPHMTRDVIYTTELRNTANELLNGNNNVKKESNARLNTLASNYRSRVIEAYRDRKIFTVFGNYYSIRRALLRRGWLEKLPQGRYPKLQQMSEETLLANAKDGNDFESVAISRFINHFPAFFIWQGKGMKDLYADVQPYRNRVRRNGNLDFTTKVGLIGCGECAHWFTQDNVCRMSYPRCYRLKNNPEERSAFVDDFRQTQCRCLMRYVWENMSVANELVDSEIGTIELSILQFSLDNLKQQLQQFDKTLESSEFKLDSEQDLEIWQNFLNNSTKVLREHAKFRAPLTEIMEIARLGRGLLDKIEEFRPDYKWDGCRNLWILKPGFSSRGMGIIIRSSLDDIVHWVSINSSRYYIAQKYIERPLLIYKTKFDIRQYLLLVIGSNTITIWLYRDCYLRFSSQEFSIDDLRESIHLTNNSVQKKYKSKANRDLRLPRCNMWTLNQFRKYLKSTDVSGDVWNDKIYKGFKENLIAVVLASLEETELVENAFELYGCDFMLDENLNPILIEINSTPDLSPSTEVTSHLCPLVLRDVIKVVVDRPLNQSVETGLFELVYEIDYKTKDDMESPEGLELAGQAMKIEQQKVKRKIITKPAFGRGKKKVVEDTGVQFLPAKTKINLSSQKNQIKSVIKAALNKQLKVTRTAQKPAAEKNVKTEELQELQPITKEALALRYTKPR